MILPAWLPIPQVRAKRDAIAVLQSVAEDIIARHVPGPIKDGRWLDALLAPDPAGHDASTTADATPRQAARDAIVTLLLAGHDITAAALAWPWDSLRPIPGCRRACGRTFAPHCRAR